MAKVINLDKFKVKQTVELDGKQYSVRGLTVAEYLDDEFQKEVDAATTHREVVAVMLRRLSSITDIPEDVLKAQDISVLQALIAVAQGVDLSEEKPADPQTAE